MKKIILVIATLALILAYSCQDQAAMAELEELKAQALVEEQNKAVAERWHMDLSIDRNWDVAEEILDPDIIVHNQDGTIMMEGIDAIKGLDAVWESMENAEIKHHKIIAEGDYVLILWDLSFDHNQEMMGIPASGNHISGVYGMDLFLLKDGKIKELWQNWDQTGFMQQLEASTEP